MVKSKTKANYLFYVPQKEAYEDIITLQISTPVLKTL